MEQHDLRRMPKQKMQPSDHGQASDADESLDRQIAALRSSIEGESHNADGGEPEWVQPTSRSSGRFLRRASLLMHSRASEIRFYSFSVGLALVVGWLIGSKL
jgi:hypothetical protein